jgi:tetrahydromethanopterin S-methyltransferase subunit F
MNSSNEDSKNLAVKINKIKRNSDLQKARDYVNSLNDYSTLLDSNGKLKSGVHKDIEMRLRSLGRKMHTSFLQSLNIIAARIPAQS